MKTMMRGALGAAGGEGRGSRIVELAQLRTPEPTGFGVNRISLGDDEEPIRQSTPPPPPFVIDKLFESLDTFTPLIRTRSRLSGREGNNEETE